VSALDPRIIGRAQLSDGPTGMPVETAVSRRRWANGAFPAAEICPLGAFVDALPDGITLGIEAPMTSLRLQGIGPAERVRRRLTATRDLCWSAGRARVLNGRPTHWSLQLAWT